MLNNFLYHVNSLRFKNDRNKMKFCNAAVIQREKHKCTLGCKVEEPRNTSPTSKSKEEKL